MKKMFNRPRDYKCLKDQGPEDLSNFFFCLCLLKSGKEELIAREEEGVFLVPEITSSCNFVGFKNKLVCAHSFTGCVWIYLLALAQRKTHTKGC